jgi:hypothetical protein
MSQGLRVLVLAPKSSQASGQTRWPNWNLPRMRSHHLVAARVESPGVGWSRAREIRRRGEPPVGGKREIQKLLHVPSPKTRQN